MTSMTTMERTGISAGVAMPGYGQPIHGPIGYGTAPFTQPGISVFSVPRCTIKTEKIADGCKLNCICDDQAACSVMQSLCSALAGGACCCCVSYNGATVCTYNFTMGLCRWENTDKGVCFHCTSGDPKCCSTIQTWCECLSSLISAGCYCTFYINGTPVCCGCCDITTSKTNTPSKR